MSKKDSKHVARRLYMEMFDPREAKTPQDIFVEGFLQGQSSALQAVADPDQREGEKPRGD